VAAGEARGGAEWESSLIRFEPQDVDEDAYQSLAIARLENHYFVNEGWLKGDKAILANTDKIRHIPTIIVQGRYDLCTPMQSAWELSQALPEAELRVVQAGHSAFDAPLAEALVRAVEDMEKLPTLERSDISPDIKPLKNIEKELLNSPVIWHKVNTNKIMYLRLNFDISDMSAEELQYFGILSDILGLIDTEKRGYSDYACDEVVSKCLFREGEQIVKRQSGISGGR